MVCNSEAIEGDIGAVSEVELWARRDDFLAALLPVAKEARVTLSRFYPDDPPMPTLRNTDCLL